MKIEVVNDIERFKSLREEWNNLLNKSSSNTFFLTWEWLYTWWKIFGKKNSLFILLYRDSLGCLQGVFPLYIKKRKIANLLSISELRFIGSGADISSEYLDSICFSGLENEIINIFMDYLFTRRRPWDILCLSDINQESESMKHTIAYLISKNIDSFTKAQRPFCPVIKLNKSDDWDIFLKSRNKSLRENMRRWRKKVKEKFKVEYLTYDSFPSLNGLFNKFVELHGMRRGQKDGVSRFTNKNYLEFHKNLIPLISQNKWLQFSILQLDSNIVAAKYNFKYKNKVYSYQGGWNPKFARFNVGQVLFSYIMEDSANNGIAEVDMLRGEESHKMRWANSIKKKNRVIISNSKLGNIYVACCRTKSKCIRLIKQLLPEKIKKKIEDKVYK